MKYRKLPVIVDAIRWLKNGDHPKDNCEIFLDPISRDPIQGEGHIVRYFRHPNVQGTKICDQCGFLMHQHGWIDTLEGDHTVCVGDWIIEGVAGEFYPCKNYIFEKTYEKIEDK
jgi:hypothetical protein